MTPFSAEKPAKGILKNNDWGTSQWYTVVCDCSDPSCAHNVSVEADNTHVTVYIYSTQQTKWYSINRWKQIWQILTRGYSEHEGVLMLDEQQAINYAETLKSAMKDVAEFKSNAR